MRIDDPGLLHQPKNTMPRINAIYAFLSVDNEDGNEGVCAAPLGGITLPMIAADEKRLEQLKPMAQRLADASGIKIKLVRFTTREDLVDYLPENYG